MANEQAVLHGIKDAQVWMNENDRAEWSASVRPGQLGADEALINALGSEEVAALFGVVTGSDAFSEACRDYSRAWADTVRAELAEINVEPEDAPVQIGEDGYPTAVED